MALGTLTVAAHSTPTFISTFISHMLLHRKSRKDKPSRQLSYQEGIAIVRRFLETVSTHGVEELQAFTAMHIPSPGWVRRRVENIPDQHILQAAEILTAQLGPEGIELVGGQKWWQVRGRYLGGEWIEMQKDYKQRIAENKPETERVLLYIHGGAYFFSSLDTHRYQVQRHARKLGARAFTPAYRLAPQYPFPCGLHDALASYLFLINEHNIPSDHIIISGDSAGGGMALALLCIIRDQKLPMPAGGVLISPWVDLTHSFPSITADDTDDYIPNEGFHYKPSLAWPPIRSDDSIYAEIDGVKVELPDQIQLYAPNKMLSHPLVSPVNQKDLGGLCPLLVMGGSGELLRDEISYVAHKAANPQAFNPEATHAPTKVHLQMYDGAAHVIPTLSFTTVAKYMYRACANFSIWAITSAEKKVERLSKAGHRAETIPLHADVSEQDAHDANQEEIDQDDVESEVSSDSDATDIPESELVSVTGSEPRFVNSMIRERVSVRGRIRPMEPFSEMQISKIPASEIGTVKQGPVKKWLAKRDAYDKKYGKELKELERIKILDRAKAKASGFLTGDLYGENPPSCALAAWSDQDMARKVGKSVDEVGEKTNKAIALWVKVASKPDEDMANKTTTENIDQSEIAAQEKANEEAGHPTDPMKYTEAPTFDKAAETSSQAELHVDKLSEQVSTAL